MSRIIGMMLVRNEQGRYLEYVLAQMKQICDDLVILDDDSTDDTRKICGMGGARVWASDKSYWGTDELMQRKFLWDKATELCKDGDWLLCLDADETFDKPKHLATLVKGLSDSVADGIAFNLYDMWSPTHYRDDDLWNAHTRPWVMMVRYDKGRDYKWREQPLHCGRFPLNACSQAVLLSPKIQHWGWSKPEDRQAKHDRYMECDPDGVSGSLAQYKSILDADPCLVRY